MDNGITSQRGPDELFVHINDRPLDVVGQSACQLPRSEQEMPA